jgi:cobalt-zinc-cadmium efflux system membrane fusion protein
VPRKEIEAARAELASLEARQGDIGASLHAREALLAPISGVIARADAVAGQVVEGGQLMYEIVDPGRVLVEATTPDVALANALGTARVREASGVRLDKIGVARTLREGVLPVTFRAQAEKAGAALPLAIGQTVTVVAALAEKRKGIVLPASSVVRGASNEPTVFIKVGAERFMPQPVEARPIDANTVMVVKGLAPDNRVVVQGASLLAQIR